ncbi:MAG: PDZ domain-containing protein [Bacillota bacterium]
MGPLFQLVKSVLRSYPGIFSNPAVDVLYLVVLVLIASQYARVQRTEERLYGTASNKAFWQTLSAVGLGLLGGLLASLLMVFIGVSVTDSGIAYLMPVALLLYLFSPRLLCFSYAGGLAALSHLIFGWPKVNVPALMALVACLHAAEAFLILLSGHTCSTPLYLSHENGDVVGGFALQRFWPIPLIVLLLIKVPDLSQVPDLIYLPDWWPLIKAPDIPGPGHPVFAMMPLIAALGYGDIAIARAPRDKARITSRNLMLFSIALLILSVAGSKWQPFAWVATLFAPIGHELVIRAGLREEYGQEPIYTPVQEGVLLLDVAEGSPAKRAGLKSGNIIRLVDDVHVADRNSLEAALAGTSGPVSLWIHDSRGSQALRRVEVRREAGEELGIIPVPEPDDKPMAGSTSEGPLLRFIKNLIKGKADKDGEGRDGEGKDEEGKGGEDGDGADNKGGSDR